MINFSVKLDNGKEVVGIAFTDTDLEKLKSGSEVLFDLESVQVGFWRKEQDGSRMFMQPRDSRILLLKADTMEEIGEAIGAPSMPSLEEIKRRSGA